MAQGGQGRVEQDPTVSAVTRVVALTPHRQAILAAVERIAASPEFRSAKRPSEFLRYVVEHALAGEVEHLKERCIGASLFGRPADYDTGADSIVRVTAADVRRRLSRYYERTGRGEQIIVELPLGSYVPEIRLEEHSARRQPEEEEPSGPSTSPPGRRPWLVAAIVGWATVAVLVVYRPPTGSLRTLGSEENALRQLPWTALFEGARGVNLVLADSAMGMLRNLGHVPVSVEDYANRSFLEPPGALPPGFRDLWKRLGAPRLTSVADARIAAGVSSLGRARGSTVSIRMARELHLTDFHSGGHFVLLGSSAANPWVELFQNQMQFQVHYDPALERQVVRMRGRDGATSLPPSVTSGQTGTAYGVLSLLDGLNGKGLVLVAQGTNMEGTEAAGQLSLDPVRLAGILRGCGIDPFGRRGRFEVLLRVMATAGSTQRTEVLLTHCKTGP